MHPMEKSMWKMSCILGKFEFQSSVFSLDVLGFLYDLF